MPDLKYLEQHVNNRFGTSAAPEIDAAMLPETGSQHRLLWRKSSRNEARICVDDSDIARAVLSEITNDEDVYIPVHPLEEERWRGESLKESGVISVSASYRTVFFEPEKGGFLSGLDFGRHAPMIKLHLENPLPGIDGDRRITKSRVEKCVGLSKVLPEILNDDPLGEQIVTVPEFLGVATMDHGVLFRKLPDRDLYPLFSLYSVDPSAPNVDSHIVAKMKMLYGDKSEMAAVDLGSQLARPLVRSLFSGFRAGFSMEMHAQNVLIEPGSDSLINIVYFRDLEGVVFSNKYRIENLLPPLFVDCENSELDSNVGPMSRWFNRNVDHDLGRVFKASLIELARSGYFGKREYKLGVQSIRKVIRECVDEAGLSRLDRYGRLLPVSRSPYGSGLGKGHYYRTTFR